jgi:Tfp pilus assembly protein PilZ
MNKRWNVRKPSSVDLVISYPAFGLLRGKAVNISHNGMFIETAAMSLCNNSKIELTLSLPELSKSPINIKAKIVHNNNKGIGVMFRNKEDHNIVNSIQQYVTSAQAQQRFAM